MAIKRRNSINATFSMASMTDVIFLLLIFFMVTSTIVFPNAIKVLLPQGKNQVAVTPDARITIDKGLNYYIAYGNNAPQAINAEDLNEKLKVLQNTNQDVFISVYADESVAYGEVVKVLAVGAENGIKMVLATRAEDSK